MIIITEEKNIIICYNKNTNNYNLRINKSSMLKLLYKVHSNVYTKKKNVGDDYVNSFATKTRWTKFEYLT